MRNHIYGEGHSVLLPGLSFQIAPFRALRTHVGPGTCRDHSSDIVRTPTFYILFWFPSQYSCPLHTLSKIRRSCSLENLLSKHERKATTGQRHWPLVNSSELSFPVGVLSNRGKIVYSGGTSWRCHQDGNSGLRLICLHNPRLRRPKWCQRADSICSFTRSPDKGFDYCRTRIRPQGTSNEISFLFSLPVTVKGLAMQQCTICDILVGTSTM